MLIGFIDWFECTVNLGMVVQFVSGYCLGSGWVVVGCVLHFL